ncbi:glycosyltransferase family 4 protein [Halarcobacter sp.]|uniref:glycosyltransferase family 4 protein n=1 Tax=Halarcobacter sp. TaxID=2321133 RepID=UPI003B002818
MMLNHKKIASIVLNNFTHDSRVEKEAVTLSSSYNVTVYALWAKGLKEEENKTYDIKRLKLKSKNFSKKKAVQALKYLELIYRFYKASDTVDYYHCHDLNTLPIAIITKYVKNRKSKIIYDAHEHETEVDGLKGFSKIIMKLMEKIFIRFADKVITVSDSIAEDYKRVYSIEKPTLVYNTPRYTNIEKNNYFRKKYNISEDIYIYIFQGALVDGRGIDELLDVFSSFNIGNRAIVFLGYGNYSEKIKEYSKKHLNIYYHDAVKPSDLLNYTVSADFGINGMIDEGYCLSYDYSLPNKLFEYLMVGLPVVVTLPEMSKFVEKHNIGVIAKSKSVYDILEAFKNLENLDLIELKENIEKVKKEYSWEKQEEKLIELYYSLKPKGK